MYVTLLERCIFIPTEFHIKIPVETGNENGMVTRSVFHTQVKPSAVAVQQDKKSKN